MPSPDVRTKAKRILLVGCGAFARQAHLPALRDAAGRAHLAAIVDRADRADGIFAACERVGLPDGIPLIEALANDDAASPAAFDALLTDIDGVIISSPEDTHKRYIRWAIGRGLPALIDKPLTVRRAEPDGTLSDPKRLVDDWRELVAAGARIAPFMLAAQRRYQNIYREIAALVRQEYLRSGYGPTFVQCLTNDGLWHTPGDYAVQSTYRDGAGKLVHTGYHVLDIVPWIIRHGQATERPGAAVARIRSATVFATTFTPSDAANAASPRPGFSGDGFADANGLGEVNAALQVALRDGDGRTVCIIQLGMLHEGLSRNPLSHDGTVTERRERAERGRTKQDVLTIYQGPTGAIFLRRFAKLTGSEGTRLGDRDHLELVHCRNALAPAAPALIDRRELTYRADDHAPTAEFLLALDDPTRDVISPVRDHGIAVRLLAAAYESMGAGESVRVEFDAEEWAQPPGPLVPHLSGARA
jgi:predicted dehydrogenase